MDITNNLFVVLFALFPILIYMYTLYFMIPKKMVSMDRGRRYFISGLMSPFLIFLIYFIFPNWGIEISNNLLLSYAFYAIVQVGILEELSKFTIFNWVTNERTSSKNDLPIAILFYSFMVSLGFALTENISYLITHYENNAIIPFLSKSQLDNSMIQLASVRSVTAVLMHMICGIIIGYFVALSKENKIKKIKINNTYKNSLVLFFNNNKYIIYGLLFASLYHGIYDLNLFLPENNYNLMFTAIILMFGLIISGFMLKNMIDLSRYKRHFKIY